ncbi:MAG: DKNYY domain-containing protein [Patescibacteria group bacterium]
MDENQSVAPPPIAPHPHKHFFIIGSLFTLLMLLVASGILYFQYSSVPVVQQQVEQIATTTTQTFSWIPLSIIEPMSGYIYSIGDGILYVTIAGHTTALQGADPLTFRVAVDQDGNTTPFSKDKNHVWYSRESDGAGGAFNEIVLGADPETFEVTSIDRSTPAAKDKNNVYEIFSRDVDSGIRVIATTTTQIPVPDAQHAYKEIFKSSTYSFLCYVRLATESNCGLYAKKLSNGEVSNLHLTIDYGAADSGSFLVAPGGGAIAIILENKILSLNPTTAEQKLLVGAPVGKEFGVYSGFPSFMPKAKWLDATHLQYSLYPEGTLDDSGTQPSETKTLEIK